MDAVSAPSSEPSAWWARRWVREALIVGSAALLVVLFLTDLLPNAFIAVAWLAGAAFLGRCGRPAAEWPIVRRALLALFGIAYLVSFFTNGLPISRKSVMLTVLIPVVIGHLGRPLRRWGWMVLELAFYVAMWFAYDYSRGIADRLGFPVQVEAPRNIDRFLFFGTDPNVWMQAHFYERRHVRWYDVAGSMIYYTHFIVPVAMAVVLWVTNRQQWGRYVRRFATTLFVAVLGFVLLPTVPPWMAADRKDFDFRILPPLARPTTRGWSHLGFKTFVDWVIRGRDWANPTAAMPSLHAGFALLVPLFLWTFIRNRWARAATLLFPLAMLATLVYFAEHYVIDALAGWIVVLASFAFWGWWERRRTAAGLPVHGPIGRWLRRLLGEPNDGMDAPRRVR